MEIIKGYQFDLNQKVYLKNIKKKFWQVLIKGNLVHYRAGVLRKGLEAKVIQMNKGYDSPSLAKAAVMIKIAGKLDKGYFSEIAKKLQTKEKKKVKNKKKQQKILMKTQKQYNNQQFLNLVDIQTTNQLSKNFTVKLWKGYQKQNEYIQYHLTDNKVKIISYKDQQQSSRVKQFANYDKAINFILKQQTYYLNNGFTPMMSSTFIQQQNKKLKQNQELNKKFKQNQELTRKKSLVQMTDNALKINSSYLQHNSEQPNVYITNQNLGKPVDQCIKCLLAENYKQGTDPTDWIMSQKLDGVRCLWTGTQMYSRNGNKFKFPNFFTKNWPKSQLDGELFIGRCQFSKTISAVKKNIPVPEQWSKLQYLVFDAPGIDKPFKNRIKIIQEQLSKIDNPFIKCHAHRPCLGYSDLFQQLQKVNKVEGQGIMLRNPESKYQNKRSKNLQKVKTFYDDQAEIIGYTEGTGRCLGWVGAFKVRNAKGIDFQVGSGLNDQIRQNPPAIGTKITYKYQQFNKQSGKPRFPTFVRTFIPT